MAEFAIRGRSGVHSDGFALSEVARRASSDSPHENLRTGCEFSRLPQLVFAFTPPAFIYASGLRALELFRRVALKNRGLATDVRKEGDIRP